MPSPRSPARRRLSATMPRPSKRSTKPWPLTPRLPRYKNSGKPSCSTQLPTRSGRQAFRPEDGAERGLQNDHGGDGGPMGFREFEDAGREEGHSGADGAAGGVFQRLAV